MTTIRFWTQLGAAAALTAGSLSTAAQPSLHVADAIVAQPGLLHLADTAGEGEGAEAEVSQDDAAYAAQLGYVLGHMRVGTALYAKGEADMSKTHMKHPRDEIYAELEPVLKARKAPGFATELDALASAVKAGAPVAEAETKFAALETAIAKNMPAMSASLAAKTAQLMVRTAAEEYEIGVKNGKIDNLHEYQDAWGFVETAKVMLAGLPAAERAEHKAQIEAIEAEITNLTSLWPDIAGKAEVKGDAKQLFAAAAKIELQALAMEETKRPGDEPGLLSSVVATLTASSCVAGSS
jgi:hypothetical protein